MRTLNNHILNNILPTLQCLFIYFFLNCSQTMGKIECGSRGQDRREHWGKMWDNRNWTTMKSCLSFFLFLLKILHGCLICFPLTKFCSNLLFNIYKDLAMPFPSEKHLLLKHVLGFIYMKSHLAVALFILVSKSWMLTP